MGRIARSWRLVTASWSVLRQDRELILLPIISAVSAVALAVVVTLGLIREDADRYLATGEYGSFSAGTWIVIALLTYALSFITIFFNVAIMCAADDRMRGGDPTLGSALRDASEHVRAIAAWSLVSVVIQAIIRLIEERGGIIGKIAGTVVGVGWALATYLILPVLIFEGLDVRAALTRSKDLFKRTWGEMVSGQLGMAALGFVGFLLIVPVLLIVGGGGQPGMVAAAVVIAVVWAVVVSAVLSALNAVFRVALYRYATEGETPEAFGHIDFATLFPPRGRRSGG